MQVDALTAAPARTAGQPLAPGAWPMPPAAGPERLRLELSPAPARLAPLPLNPRPLAPQPLSPTPSLRTPAVNPVRPAPDGAASGRRVTAGEAALVRSVFGASIDLDKVRIYGRKYTVFQRDDIIMSPNGNIYFPPSAHRPDFSAASTWEKALLLHEMTHVWQHQNGTNVLVEGAKLHIGGKDPYAYVLTAGRDLGDYNIEQQGEIVSDWFMVQAGVKVVSRQQQDLMGQVLRRFLADPTYRRRHGPALAADVLPMSLVSFRELPGLANTMDDPTLAASFGDDVNRWRPQAQARKVDP